MQRLYTQGWQARPHKHIVAVLRLFLVQHVHARHISDLTDQFVNAPLMPTKDMRDNQGVDNLT